MPTNWRGQGATFTAIAFFACTMCCGAAGPAGLCLAAKGARNTLGFVFLPSLSERGCAHKIRQRLTRMCKAQASTEQADESLAKSRRHASHTLLAGFTAAFAGGCVTSRAFAATPSLDARNSAGVGINSLDLSNIDKPSAPAPPKADPAMGNKKPGKGSKAAGLAIFQDDNLGYAFAMPPNWRGQSKALDSGGQILAFVDDNLEGRPDVLVTVVAQPTKLESIDELKTAIVPKGKVLNQKIETRNINQPDGTVILYESMINDETRAIALFSLRIKPQGNWLIVMTAQAPTQDFPKYDSEFKEIMKGYRPTYSQVDLNEISDQDLGKKVKDIQLEAPIMAIPFGGRKR